MCCQGVQDVFLKERNLLKAKFGTGVEILAMKADQGPVSQRVAINRTIDINRSSMANCVLRKPAINQNPLWNGAQVTVQVSICSILNNLWTSPPPPPPIPGWDWCWSQGPVSAESRLQECDRQGLQARGCSSQGQGSSSIWSQAGGSHGSWWTWGGSNCRQNHSSGRESERTEISESWEGMECRYSLQLEEAWLHYHAYMKQIFVYVKVFDDLQKAGVMKPLLLRSKYSSTSLIRPPFIRISLLSGRDLVVIVFFVCTIITGKRGDFKLNQNSYTNSHELHIIPNIINIHSHQIFF